jgi:hypothetical protein
LKRGVFALVGASDEAVSDVIASYSRVMHMPYVTTGLVAGGGGFTFSLSLPYDRAIVDLIRYYSWNTVYYIYDSEFGMILTIQASYLPYLLNSFIRQVACLCK